MGSKWSRRDCKIRQSRLAVLRGGETLAQAQNKLVGT
nr:MAG TPA: hypothetical protein [Caudoviricetes sp.]